MDSICAELLQLPHGSSVEEKVAELRRDPAVLYAEPNYLVQLLNVPNDPLFPQEWAMQNTGQTGGTAGKDIGAPQAWDVTTGDSTLKIAIVDCGVDYTHPDLAQNIWTNPGEIPGNDNDDDGNGYIDDVHGWDFVRRDSDPQDECDHGTSVAGVVAAAGNNAMGIAGVCWHAKLICVNVTDETGKAIDIVGASEGIRYAIHAGARIINISWGAKGGGATLKAVIDEAQRAGVIVVASAGNDGYDQNPDQVTFDEHPYVIDKLYPASFDLPNVVSVGGCDHNGQRVSTSTYGKIDVDLLAPGLDVFTTQKGGAYNHNSGTSMAAPFVTGALGLVLSAHPLWSYTQAIRQVLSQVDWSADLDNIVATGGTLNMGHALTQVDTTAPSAIADLAVTLVASDSVQLRWHAPGDDGGLGHSRSYDVRYSMSPITSATLNTAMQAVVPSPKMTGQLETAAVRQLQANQQYYFCIRALDEMDNIGAMSNVVTTSTTAPPALAVTPPAWQAESSVGQTSTMAFTVSNTGSASVHCETSTSAAWLSIAEGRSFTLPGGSSATLAVTASAQGLVDSTYRDAVMVIGDNINAAPVRIPVTYTVTGTPRMQTNVNALAFGTVALGDSVTRTLLVGNIGGTKALTVSSVIVHASNLAVRTTTPLTVPRGAREPVTFTWTPASAGTLTDTVAVSGDAPDKPLIRIPVGGTAVAVPHATWSPQALEASLAVPDTVELPLMLSNDGDGALTWQAQGTASWVHARPPSGQIAGHGSVTILVALDSRELFEGDHLASVGITTNDAQHTAVSVPTTLHVTGSPHLIVVPSILSFGSVYAGHPKLLQLQLKNDGSGTLSGAISGMSQGSMTFQSTEFELGDGQGFDVPVQFTPHAAGNLTMNMALESNDPSGPTAVTMTGQGVSAAAFKVSVTSISRVLDPQESSSQTLQIRNDGNLAMNWAVTVDDSASQGTSWLSLSSMSGQLTSLHTQNVTLTLSSVSTAIGNYRATLRFSSNDPVDSVVTVPVDLHITGTPQLAVDLDGPLDFKAVALGYSKADTLVVRNIGDGTLTIDDLSIEMYVPEGQMEEAGTIRGGGLPAPVYTLDSYDTEIPPGGRGAIALRFTPQATGIVLATLHVVTNDPVTPQLDLDLKALGYPAPAVAVTPDSISQMLVPGQSVTDTLTIHNGAEGRLVWVARAIDLEAGGTATWLSLAATSGHVDADTSATLVLTSHNTSLSPGLHHGAIKLTTNDPLIPVFDVPVSCAVPAVFVAPDNVDFGRLVVGQLNDTFLRFTNLTDAPLHVTGIQLSLGPFSAKSIAVEAPAHGYILLELKCAPVVPGEVSGTLTVSTDSPLTPEIVVPLHALCVAPPVMSVSPPQIDLALAFGQQAARTLMIGNSDGDTLRPIVTPLFTIFNTNPAGVPQWFTLSAAPTVPPGESRPLIVTFDEREIPVGPYTGSVVLESPVTGLPSRFLRVPVSLNLRALAPVITVSDLDIGNVIVGDVVQDSIWVHNVGDATLNVEAEANVPDGFSTTGTPLTFSVAPGDSAPLGIRYAPTEPCTACEATFDIICNDPTHGNVSVTVHASASRGNMAALPTAFGLKRLGATGTTDLELSLTEHTRAEVIVFDVGGRRVRRLFDGVHEAGDYALRWDGRDEGGASVSAGMYFIRATTPRRSVVVRAVVLHR